MKSNIKISIILLALVISSVIFTKQASAQQTYVSFQVFYDQLSPYGEWVDYPNYGYVWIPDAGPDFAPYSTRGYWLLTEYGWTWMSDYDWGWAPFHYGRWDYDNYYGWIWIPDNEWGPSWVTWRRADGYYGWTPMGPGVNISVSFGREYHRHNNHWIFVRDRDFGRSDIHQYYVNRTDHDRIIRNSSVINKTYVDSRRHTTYISGPERDEVQKVTGRRVSSVAIQETNKPGQDMSDGRLRIYRPQVKKNNDTEHRPAPSRIANLKDVKHPSERNATMQPRNVRPYVNKSQEQQPNNVKTENNNARPLQQRNVSPSDNKRQVQQPKNVNQQSNREQPAQPRNVNPPPNNKRGQQPNTAKPQENKRNEKSKDSESEQNKRR